jgi:SAM-dependent methyltransferase
MEHETDADAAMDPLEHWATTLRDWAIPDEIIAQAPRSPWIHPVESFRPEGDLRVDTPSRLRALEALDGVDEPSVLDVGCGGGRGAFGLTPPAVRVIGVDHQQPMLDVFAEEAGRRGVAVEIVLGDWPDVSERTPSADVVVCHHVLYNVQALEPFARALDSHAHRRVVLELPWQHPLSSLSPFWAHFWGLERPTSPTAEDALVALRRLGLDAVLEEFEVPVVDAPVTALSVEHTRIRLCLPAERDTEIEAMMRANPARPRRLATIWWDVS